MVQLVEELVSEGKNHIIDLWYSTIPSYRLEESVKLGPGKWHIRFNEYRGFGYIPGILIHLLDFVTTLFGDIVSLLAYIPFGVGGAIWYLTEELLDEATEHYYYKYKAKRPYMCDEDILKLAQSAAAWDISLIFVSLHIISGLVIGHVYWHLIG